MLPEAASVLYNASRYNGRECTLHCGKPAQPTRLVAQLDIRAQPPCASTSRNYTQRGKSHVLPPCDVCQLTFHPSSSQVCTYAWQVMRMQVTARLPSARGSDAAHAFGNGECKECKDGVHVVALFDGNAFRLELLSASISGLQCDAPTLPTPTA
jgi:hypothetical protein